jgi:predicted RecA/RadA family phage recombinase
MGLVGKVSSGNAGSITVSSIMRANDVPNLPEGRIWVGDGNTLVSDTVFVDESNLRLGLGTVVPTEKLHVEGNARVTGTVIGGVSAIITTSVINQGVSGMYDDLDGWDTNYVSGEIMKAQPNGEDVTVGECLVLTDGFSWMKADASDVNASSGMLGIALQTSVLGNGVDILIAGFAETVKVENTSATTGTPMYLRENTAGEMSDTLPSGGIMRLVGYCYNNDQEQGNAKFILRFDPDNTWVEI